MSQFTRLTSRLAPLGIENVDTDQIIPASYLKVTVKTGLGEGLFGRWRLAADGSPDDQFFLNKPEYAGAEILLAGDNFGCGSSREHAPWALLDYGFRALISTRFADIFRSNSLKNGLLLVEVDREVHSRLFASVAEDASGEVSIDLESELWVAPWGEEISFEIDPFSRRCLLRGIDQLGYLLERSSAISEFEDARVPRIDTRA